MSDDAPEGAMIRITLATFYGEVTRDLTEIKGAVSGIGEMKERLARSEAKNDARFDKIETRVTVLEKFKWALFGACVAVAAAGGILTPQLFAGVG